MSLVMKLRTSCNPTPADHRRYADLLRADDPKNLDELKRLMIVLHKNAIDVKADQDTVKSVVKLQATVGVGSNTTSQVTALWKDIEYHEQESKRIAEERRDAIQPVYEQRAAVLRAESDARDAIIELEKLKLKNPELLSDLVIPSASQLG